MIKSESFDLVFKALPVSAILLKPNLTSYQIENINEAYINCLGIDQKDYIGEEIENLYSYIPKNVDSKNFLIVLLQSLNEVRENHQINKLREEVHYFLTDTPDTILKKQVDIENKPIINDKGELIYILHILTDVTEIEHSKCKIETLSTLERKNLTELEGTKNELSRIMEHSADMICTTDELGNFILVSQACEEILGYKPEELIGKNSTSILHPSVIDESINIGSKVRDGQELKDFQNLCIKKDGSTVPIIWSVKWIEADQRYYCICKDATEKLAYENQLIASEKKYKTLFENNPTPMFIWDIETLEILDSNEEALLLYGYNKEEFLSKSIKNLIPKEKIKILEHSFKSNAHFGKINKEVWLSFKKDKTLIYVEISGHIILYKGIKCALVTAIDVTSKVKLEELQKFEQRDKEALINNTEDLIWSVDRNFNLIATNKAFLENLYDTTKLIFKRGDSVLNETLFPKDFIELWRALYNKALKGKSFKKNLTPNNNKDGKWIEISFNPIFNDNNKITGVACRSTDITQQKNAAEELKRSEENLSEAQKLAKLGSWEIDLVNNTAILSDELYRILEIDKTNATIYPSFLFDLVAVEDKALKKELTLEATLNGTAFTQEFQITTAKGNTKILKEFGYGKKSADGVVFKLFGTVQDITEIKKLELKQQELLEKQRLLFSIVTSSDDAIISKTLSGDITSWNKGAERMFGFTEKEVLNKHISLIIPPNLLHEKKSIMDVVNKGQHVHNFDTIRKHKDGSIKQVSLTVSPIFNDDNLIIGTSITARDISKVKDLETQQKSLLEKQKLLTSIVSSTEDAIISKTLKGIITSWNKGAENIFGYEEKDVLGKDISLIIPKNLLQEERNIMESIKSGKHIRNFETIRKNKNNKQIHVSLTNSPIYNTEGKIIGVSKILKDISEKKKSENQLLDAYKEKGTILESIGDAFFAVDNNFIVTYWNKKAAKELQTPIEAIIGKQLFVDVFQESAQSYSAQQYRLALKTQKQINFTDYHPITKKYFDVTAYPTKKGLSVYFRNTTEERKIQQQFEAVTQNMPGITYRCKMDKDWTMLFLSDGLKEITGYQPAELINNKIKSFKSIIYPDDIKGTYVIENEVRNKQVFNVQYRIICKDERIIWVENIGRGVFNINGELDFIDGIILDITKRKTDEDKLQKLNTELKNKTTKLTAINDELEQFAYVASHDLQEPLRMVSSFLTLLKGKYEDQLDDEGNKFIFFAVDGAKRMRKIILDLLEFSRIGKTNSNKEEVNLNLIVQNISKLFIKQIEARKAEIISAELPTINNYNTPMQQIFSNLIGNALKYGATKINISYKENKTHFEFAIADNGIGIHPDYHEKIFVIFQRLHNKDEYSGTGIGLAITKKIVEGFGGKIWVESEENKGSTFNFTISKNS